MKKEDDDNGSVNKILKEQDLKLLFDVLFRDTRKFWDYLKIEQVQIKENNKSGE